MKKIIVLIAISACEFNISYSQPGTLDSSFGNNGIVCTAIGSATKLATASATDVLTQPDGTIYVIVQSQVYTTITRLLADGSIDSSYGNKGYSQTIRMDSRSAALQTNGKIVVAGSVRIDRKSQFALARFTTDGTLDPGFSEDGKQTTSFTGDAEAWDMVIQPDRKILLAGSAGDYAALARYNSDGTPDTTFSGDGKLIADFASGDDGASSVAIQNDGKIVVAGTSEGDFTVARYNTDGTLDKTFSADGRQTTDFGGDDRALSITIQSDGKIVVAGDVYKCDDSGCTGREFALARYNTNGTADNTFSEDGKQTTNFGRYTYAIAEAVAIQSDGKIVVAGTMGETGGYFLLARYNTDGTLDPNFSDDGKLIIDVGYLGGASSLVIQSDGKLVVAGTNESGNFALARCNTDGTPDTTFGGDGMVTGYVPAYNTRYNSTAIQTDGKIVVAGAAQDGKNLAFALARYNTDGTLDTNFSGDGKLTTDFTSHPEAALAVAIQNDGKIVAVGNTGTDHTDFAIARYNTDGSLDTTFSKDGKQITKFGYSSSARSIAIQSDGKIVVAGSAGEYYSSNFALARFNTDGTLDPTFSGDGKLLTDFGDTSSSARSVVIQSDGKIVVAGNTGTDHPDFALARYNNDGTLDKTFSGDGKVTSDFGFDDQLNSITLQDDGKIVVAGVAESSPTDQGGDADFALARYNTNGTLDKTFSEDGKQTADFTSGNDVANSIGIQRDGKIIVAGGTSNSTNFALARVNTDGSLDNSFGEDGKQVTDVSEGIDAIIDIAIFGNKLYAVGVEIFGGGSLGVVARYQLDDETENKAPVVSLSIPYDIVKYSAPARIKLNATAIDEDGTITKVQFFNGTTRLHTEDVHPYGFLWVDVPAGNYTLTAKAFDNSGNVTTSNSIKVSVVEENVPPCCKNCKSYQ
jgi:uncharacterized delta-60 repeat protein